MNRELAVLWVLLIALLIFGCTESSSQYSSTSANQLVNNGTTAVTPNQNNQTSANPNSTPEQNNPALVHRYSSLIGTSFVDPDYGQNDINITIKGFDTTYETQQDVDEAHILFLAENTGKKATSEFCSDFTLIDDKGREFTLQGQIFAPFYFGVSKVTEGEIQPGLSILLECNQVFPKNATLTSLIVQHMFTGPTVVANLSATSGKTPPQQTNTSSSASNPSQPVPDPYSKYYGKTAIQDTFTIRLDNISESQPDANGAKSIAITFSVLNDGDKTNTLWREIYIKDQKGRYYQQDSWSCTFSAIHAGINDTETCIFYQVPASSEPAEVVTTSMNYGEQNNYTPLFRLQ